VLVDSAWGESVNGQEGGNTWLVHTLLNVTKAKVCASMVLARSFLASKRGRAIADRKSCGMKAKDSRFTASVSVVKGTEDER
jgi:hypothetical protein